MLPVGRVGLRGLHAASFLFPDVSYRVNSGLDCLIYVFGEVCFWLCNVWRVNCGRLFGVFWSIGARESGIFNIFWLVEENIRVHKA